MNELKSKLASHAIYSLLDKHFKNFTGVVPSVQRISPHCQVVKDPDVLPDFVPLVKVQARLVTALPKCSETSPDLCVIDPGGWVTTGPEYPLKFLTTVGSWSLFDISDHSKKLKPEVFIWNKSETAERRLRARELRFQFRWSVGEILSDMKEVWPTDEPIVISAGLAEPTSCRLTVSGALSNYTSDVPPKVNTTNEVLVFTPILEGGSGHLTLADVTVSYSGGPNSLGSWNHPVEGVVTASIRTPLGKRFSCSLRVTPISFPETIRINGYSDCRFFNDLKRYYFFDKTNTAFENKILVRIPGLKAKFTVPEVPFKGILNAGAASNGAIAFNPAGNIIIPPTHKQKYLSPIIVVRKFVPGGSGLGVGNSLYYGVVDPNSYHVTQLRPIGRPELLPGDLVVFQMFLPKPIISRRTVGFTTISTNLRDAYSKPTFFEFSPYTTDEIPFDQVIPFVNASCSPFFQFTPPIRDDGKPLPNSLRSQTLCLFSRTFTAEDLLAGRVNLDVLHLVPETAVHEYPENLKRLNQGNRCIPKNPGILRDCWEVSMSKTGVSAQTDPFSSHLSCRTETTRVVPKVVVTEETVCSGSGNRYSCSVVEKTTTTEVLVTEISYRPSCLVRETLNECDQNLAIRFSGYNMQMIAALGCSVINNRSGVAVTATLEGQGVLPYNPRFGGSHPLPFTSYPAALVNGHAALGYGCIPCRFEDDALNLGKSLFNTTSVLPVDQDVSNSRRPIFSFIKTKAPAECVNEVNFEVRYFGSKECDGVSTPPGHFCSSDNIAPTSCPGLGNVAGRFTAPICPNSGFEYSHVSVSWSPIIIDVMGNGIKISRDERMAVPFDIEGKGKKMRVDWPLNVQEVAFLVLPDERGAVKSIKQLFGNYGNYAHGFEALKALDSNHDGKIDAGDRLYKRLRLWFDENRDGIADLQELQNLSDWGVTSLNTDFVQYTQEGVEGQTLYSTYFNSRWGKILNFGDYYFKGYGYAE
ncbi:MAG: hypothetical protein NZ480_00030 [Bdellovibrionaceae bacterium]|nr:hypothetical protein [Pseudobdellovibrionaceae bacterium]